MPILVIAVIVIVAIGTGAYFFTTETVPEAPAENKNEVVRPETMLEDMEAKPQTTPEPAPVSEPEIETETEVIQPVESELEPEPATVSEVIEPEPEPVAPATEFTNGNYTTSVSYLTPSRSSHSMDVTFTIENDVVTASSIVYDDGDGPSNSHQRRFDAAYKASVVGIALDEVSLSRTAGASLTTESFNEAITQIETNARG